LSEDDIFGCFQGSSGNQGGQKPILTSTSRVCERRKWIIEIVLG